MPWPGRRARRASVQQILNDRSYTAEAVQKLFAAHQGKEESRRTSAPWACWPITPRSNSNTKAPSNNFCAMNSNTWWWKRSIIARAGIALLREEVGGRATFFVDSLRKLNVLPHEPIVPFEIEKETVSRLDRLVEFRDPLGPAAKQFLPRLQSAFLVEQAEVAERLARENPAYSFVIPDGTTYQGRVVSGGRPSESGPLVMKRELRALDAEVLQLERAASRSAGGSASRRGRTSRQ